MLGDCFIIINSKSSPTSLVMLHDTLGAMLLVTDEWTAKAILKVRLSVAGVDASAKFTATNLM